MSRHILMVEDQEDTRQILRDLLGNAGYELTEADNGEEAIAASCNRRCVPSQLRDTSAALRPLII
jgi:two-component system, cell cycle response regulator DivK